MMINENYVPGSPVEDDFNKADVTVGCGCKIIKDVLAFTKEKKIEYADLSWADEMGLWHHVVVPVGELTLSSMEFGILMPDGKILKPDPLSAKIAPFSQPNTMHLTCVDVSYESSPKETRRDLKTKQLNPVWIEMIQKRLLESQTKKSVEIDKLLNADVDEPAMGFYQRPGEDFIEWKMVSTRNSPTFNDRVPGSPPLFSDLSPSSSSSDDSSSDSLSPIPSTSPSPSPPKIKINKALTNLINPATETPDAADLPAGYKVPPLLRPRQVHPCKNKQDDKKAKKRKAMEHMFCRHCGAKDTPEWRRGPDGRKSLCNACGLHYSKVVKKETMTISQGRSFNVNALLNPA